MQCLDLFFFLVIPLLFFFLFSIRVCARACVNLSHILPRQRRLFATIQSASRCFQVCALLGHTDLYKGLGPHAKIK